jgi:hypothetical protein
VSLWIDGYGHIQNTRPSNPKVTAVGQLLRTVYDTTVFSPERIVFEAAPTLGEGLRKGQSKAWFVDGKDDYLNISMLGKPKSGRMKEFNTKVEEAKVKNRQDPYVVECAKEFDNNVRRNHAEGKYLNDPELHDKSVDKCIAILRKRAENRILPIDFPIFTKDKGVVLVGDVLNEPAKYHQTYCRDPYEPEYNGGSDSQARINSAEEQPYIYSFAHGGGIRYKLGWDVSQSEESAELDKFMNNIVTLKAGGYVELDTMTQLTSGATLNAVYGHLEMYGDDGKRKQPANWLGKQADKQVAAAVMWEPVEELFLHRHGETYVNCYKKERVEEVNRPDLLKAWFTLVDHIFGEHMDYVLDHLAFSIQNPDTKIRWQILVVGVPRTGKTMAFKIPLMAMGDNANIVSGEDLKRGWGDIWLGKKMMLIEELYDFDKGIVNDLKPKFANDNVESINPKGKGLVMQRNLYSMYMLTNHHDAVAMNANEDKLLVIESPKYRLDDEIYNTIGFNEKETAAAVYHYLAKRDVSKFQHQFLPVRTAALLKMCEASQSDHVKRMWDVLTEFAEDDETPEQVIVMEELVAYLKEDSPKVSGKNLAGVLRSAGWDDYRINVKNDDDKWVKRRIWTNIENFNDLSNEEKITMFDFRRSFPVLDQFRNRLNNVRNGLYKTDYERHLEMQKMLNRLQRERDGTMLKSVDNDKLIDFD